MTDKEMDDYILSQLSRTDYIRASDIRPAPGMTLEQKRSSLNRLLRKHRVRKGALPPPHRSKGWRRRG